MKINERIKYFLFPPKCAGCDSPISIFGTSEIPAFCQECEDKWRKSMLDVCPCCGGFISECRSVPKSVKGKNVSAHIKLTVYKPGNKYGTVNQLLYKMKDSPEARFYDFAASELTVKLCAYLKENKILPSELVFVYIPRKASSVAAHGADQSKEIAERLAKYCGGEFYPKLIRRRGGREQKKLDGSARFANMKEALYPSPDCESLVKGKRAVIVDDILTTGASISSAVSILESAGCIQELILSVAQTDR